MTMGLSCCRRAALNCDWRDTRTGTGGAGFSVSARTYSVSNVTTCLTGRAWRDHLSDNGAALTFNFLIATGAVFVARQWDRCAPQRTHAFRWSTLVPQTEPRLAT